MKCKNLGERILNLRKERGITRAELASQIGLTSSYIVKIENAQRTASLEEAEKISRALGICINTLLNYEKVTEEKSFYKAFVTKGMNKKELEDIKRFERLFDALSTQE